MSYSRSVLALVGFAAVTLAAVARLDAEDAKDKDLAETVEKAAEFKTLAGALDVADLKAVLKGEGPFTVFAPTDDAFTALGSDAVKSLVAVQKRLTPNIKKLTRDDGHLTAILTFHVVKGNLKRKDLLALAKDGKSLETVNGAKLKLSLDGETLKVGGAVVGKTDLSAKNGRIFVVDGVLLPPAPALDIPGRKRVPACPPADEPFVWQRTITPASPRSDRERLAALWKRAAEQTPPLGDKDKWDARVGEIVKLADRYAAEKDPQKAADAASALVQSANCIGCHAEHQKTPFSRPR